MAEGKSMLTVTADAAGIALRLGKAGEGLAGAVADAAARGLSNLLYDHFLRREGRHGRSGWPKSHYWADAAESVSARAAGDGACEVSARAPGLMMHIDGGTILPRRGRFLAIPISPEVAGVWPREMMQRDKGVKLVPVRGVKGEGYLLARQREGGGKALEPLWRLARRASLKADPSVLPPEAERTNAATDAAKAALDALTRTGATA